ncbi:hypothetical protein EWM64_g2543 [Hericium alpestre]|uniref:Uncharacterized protein n=1 Tax=Hericium alpestre TaxID=135208 RepID=A0A4Z0A367_9AGAM|nr:hypothetical protein EWM64_g2543 [Hericium alpestre]
MASPLPGLPAAELMNEPALRTIAENSTLFKIVTPVDVNRFEALLVNHPNRPFVDSILHGLRHGFWPCAGADLDKYPSTREFPERDHSPADLEFLKKQCEEEEQLDRFSALFGPPNGLLLPGMYCVPVHAVPKLNSDKLRMVVDHSAGDFSLNSMIDKADIHVNLDNIQDLGHNLLLHCKQLRKNSRWLWKSDVSMAYRRLPMHPLWQLKQVITVDGVRRIDRCNNFRGRTSGMLWCTFMSLILWIAIHEKGIDALLAYIDDCFSDDPSKHLIYYARYDDFLPPKQVALLLLWDEIKLPHDKPKQLFGSVCTIIGLDVDLLHMKISLSPEHRTALITGVCSFMLDAPQRCRHLVEWQRILGWMNWGLNVAPLLCPALQPGYDKIAGCSISRAPIYLNKTVTRDFLWFADAFQSFNGIHFITSHVWDSSQADLVIYCDASLTGGLAFWSPSHNRGFVSERPPSPSDADTIFWYEALTVVSALEWVCSLQHKPRCLAIFSDSLNTIQMFNSLRARPSYNDLLLFTCHNLLLHQIDLHIFHIAGDLNIIANALSHNLFDVVSQYKPDLDVCLFTPPRVALGADKC